MPDQSIGQPTEKSVRTSLQTAFLDLMVKEKKAVTIFLINGVKLQGFIEGYDNDGVLLEHKNHRQLIMKHAISTIVPIEIMIPYTKLIAQD